MRKLYKFKLYKRYRQDLWSELYSLFIKNNMVEEPRLIIKVKNMENKKIHILRNNLPETSQEQGYYKLSKRKDLFKCLDIIFFYNKTYQMSFLVSRDKKYLSRTSKYGLLLLEKQKLYNYYWNISNDQFKNLLILAYKIRGHVASNFLSLLESRVDNILYRLNVAYSRGESRMLIKKGIVKVNNKVIYSYNHVLNIGDVIEVSSVLFKKGSVLDLKKKIFNRISYFLYPSKYLEASFLLKDKVVAIFYRRPDVNEIFYPFGLDVKKIINFYKKK